jgi:hypothetical protein
MGISVNNKEFEQLWKMIKKPIKKISLKEKNAAGRIDTQESGRSSRRSNKKTELDEPESEVLSYTEIL